MPKVQLGDNDSEDKLPVVEVIRGAWRDDGMRWVVMGCEARGVWQVPDDATGDVTRLGQDVAEAAGAAQGIEEGAAAGGAMELEQPAAAKEGAQVGTSADGSTPAMEASQYDKEENVQVRACVQGAAWAEAWVGAWGDMVGAWGIGRTAGLSATQ